MPEADGRSLVTNTTPLIALTAATGGLQPQEAETRARVKELEGMLK
jgi:hypothetical protein